MRLRSLVITCPDTGKDVYTGFAMTKQAFDASTLSDIPVKQCPHCGDQHTWSIEDARLGDDQPEK
jgi:hypothetical protein